MESISRISSLLETARDLTLEAARDAGPRKSTRPLPAPQIKKLLDSRQEREVLDGLRRIIAMQYANPPQATLTFFPAVLKTLSHPYPSTRPLVYNYLIHHAELDPDTALLSINTIQKSLSDSSPRVRAMALKTMAGIRVPVISQIVSLAIKKGVSDLSPLVRKAAALACVKCVRLDETTRSQVEEYLAVLLADKQYYVAGAAVQAFMEVCSTERLDLIHPVYRRLCRMVVDMDEWGQLALLKLMTLYARRCFPRQTKRTKRAQTREQKARDFYEDLEPESQSQSFEADYEEISIADPDLTLFLTSIAPLLQSRTSAVILAVARAYLYLGPSTHLPSAIGPLIALLRSPQDIQQVALHNMVQVCLAQPSLFVPYYRHFLLRSTEPPNTRGLKLEILTLIFPSCSPEIQSLLLAELEHFSRSPNPALVRESVRAIGRCAQSPNLTSSRRCLALLLNQLHSSDDNLVGEAMQVIRHLIQRSPTEHKKTVIRLARNLDHLTSATARAGIVWLVGEFADSARDEVGQNGGVAADVWRILVKGYAGEGEEVRGQIVGLGAKVYLRWLNERKKEKEEKSVNGAGGELLLSPRTKENHDGEERGFAGNAVTHQQQEEKETSHPIELLWQHTLLLARYTPSYHLRDRARLYRALLAIPSSTELASLLLLAPKPVPQAPSPSESRREYLLGSASLVVGEDMRGVALPEWVEEGREPDAALRDETGDGTGEYVGQGESGRAGTVSAGERLDGLLAPGGGVGPAKKGGRTLDAWLNEEEGTESGGESEGSVESEEETSTEDETEEESESEEDEEAGLVK
ncbi:AP-3 complex subunit beta [Friedmanniomyces endolithicus]|uniref:AP-3 complex subunit beta n=1 Tax=Friedmanniomyces endolithicus TaxID=329885 RepID=A0AAN6KHE3_9PEZI|nr:AP-3 complex subunit beta [Friedmanniomyces endolithicus]KAK0816113.1 AP-3 complex subunit beta [Friedmanniomyces endolithicus]KAK0983133.1 AP-3 complex subunit beta [Friedmanniomyces endolithicus]